MKHIHLVACLILIPSALPGQTCTLAGKATDASGALVASAKITLLSPRTLQAFDAPGFLTRATTIHGNVIRLKWSDCHADW